MKIFNKIKKKPKFGACINDCFTLCCTLKLNSSVSTLLDFHVGLWVHITEYRDASNILADLFEDLPQLMLCRIIIIQLDDVCTGIWISITGKFHSLPFPDHYLA